MTEPFPVSPELWLGGDPSEYAVEVLRNGGFGTRHLPSGKMVPHVRANPSIDPSMQGAGGLGGGMSALGKLGVANLAVGLLNLGVSAWTAWKVHKLDKKIDGLSEGIERIDGKLDGLSNFMETSIAHLDGLIKTNSLMLGLVIENQGRMATALDRLADEVRGGFDSIESVIMTTEARRESQDLEEQMRALLRYYRSCTRALEKENPPSANDLRQIIDGANRLVAWTETRLGRIPVGHSERVPLVVASAFAHHLEFEARAVSNDAPPTFEEQYSELRNLIRNEIQALTTDVSVYDLAVGHAGTIEHYVFLDRALRAPPTMLEFESGAIMPCRPTSTMSWNDGLEEFRHLFRSSSNVEPVAIPLGTLRERRAWNALSDLPYEEFDDTVDTKRLKDCLGAPPGIMMSEESLCHLLLKGPSAHPELTARLSRELVPC